MKVCLQDHHLKIQSRKAKLAYPYIKEKMSYPFVSFASPPLSRTPKDPGRRQRERGKRAKSGSITTQNPMATGSRSQRHVSFRKIFLMCFWKLCFSSHTRILGRNIIYHLLPNSRPRGRTAAGIRVRGRDRLVSERAGF